MCYTGRCEFENHMGGCTINDYKKFKEKYSYTSCFVGGYIQCEEEEVLYNTHQEEIKDIIERYYKE